MKRKEHQIIDGVECKECFKCKQFKSIKEFSKCNQTWDNLQQACKLCQKQYREQNKEYYLNYSKKHRIENKEYYSNYHMKWNIKNQEPEKQRLKERYVQNREDVLRKSKEYYKKNKKQKLAKAREWSKRNPEFVRAKAQKQRAKRKNLVATLTKEEWAKCKNYFKDSQGKIHCAYCDKALKRATQDHVIPVNKGGGYTMENIIPACGSCNSSKQDHNMEEWYRKQEYFDEERLSKIYKYIKSVKLAKAAG